jgi:hypothetical protein
MRVLCVGRHAYLSGHLCRFFLDLGVDTRPAVGMQEAAAVASSYLPDAVICDYDLLASISLERWEGDPLLSRIPVIAVSLTRRPDEVQQTNLNGIAGFLYLPTLEREDALRVLAAAKRPGGVSAPGSLAWPRSHVAQFQ